ncbi:MAG: GNAT family N-acetyltransferase [Candidatus Thermoplasmatota archaeon]
MQLRFSVSPHRPSDRAGLRDIFPEIYEEYAGRLRRHLLLVARTRRRVIGVLFLQWYEEACYFDPAVTRYAEIHEVHVHPDFRDRGVATGLVKRALQEATRRGCEAVYLVTDDFNAPARRLYERSGFAAHNVVIRYKKTLTSSGRPRAPR